MRQMLINGDYVELWCASPGTDVTCVHRSQSSQQHRFSSCRHGRIRLMFPWFAVLYWYVIIRRYLILWTESMVRWTKNGQIKWATFVITTTWKIKNFMLSLSGFLRRLVRSAGLQVLLVSILCQYRGADKFLTRPGRKQARKHVRDARDFNNIETRAVIKFFFSCKARRRRKFTPFWQKH